MSVTYLTSKSPQDKTAIPGSIFEDIVQHSANPFAAGYLDGRIICWNHAFEELTGYSSEELGSLNWIDTLTPRGEDSLSHMINGNTKISRSNRLLRRKDGSLLPIKFTVRQAQCSGEAYELYYGFITDISGEKELQEALHYQQAYKKLMHNTAVRFISLDSSEVDTEICNTLGFVGDFIGADHGFVILLEDGRQDIKNTCEWSAVSGMASKALFTDTVLSDFSSFMSELYLTRDTSGWEYSLARATAEVNELLGRDAGSIMALPMLSKKNLLGFLGFTTLDRRVWSEQDITLLRIMSEIFIDALVRKKSKLMLDIGNRLMDIVSEGIMVFTPGSIRWVNQTFTALTGYSFDEAVGQDYAKLGLYQFNEQKAQMEESLNETGQWQGNFMVCHKNGTTVPCLLSLNSLHNKDGDAAFTVAIFTDITEHEKLRQEQFHLQELSAAIQKSASLSSMSAGIVHEIAQPLNSIKILIEGLRYLYSNYHEVSETEVCNKLADVSKELHHIDEIIRHMRSFASLSANPQIEAYNLNDSITRILRLLSRQLTAHEIKVTTMLSENLPRVWVNLNRLDAVLVNLLTNAMQSLDRVDHNNKEIICRTSLEADYVILEISDNGSGIEESILDYIFEPFVTTKASRQGMGLGLSVVHTIITRLGGRIRACNNKSGGASFIIKLPILDRKDIQN